LVSPAQSFFVPSLQFSLLYLVQTGSEAHPTFYSLGTGDSFPEGKRQGLEADHSPPTSAEVKKTLIYTSTTSYVFMALSKDNILFFCLQNLILIFDKGRAVISF
jgi:hypothetical protein